MQTIVKLQDLAKSYRTGEIEVQAVRGVSLEVRPGEFVAIMGASGSGKSTLMNTLGCLDRPSGGRYWLDDTETSTLESDTLADLRNRKLGFVFQGFNLLPRTTAIENVELPLLYARNSYTRRQRHDRAVHALTIVGLGERTTHHPNQLSGGQQQRVAIARALVNEPKLLLADEPTGNLDTLTSIEIMGMFQRLNDAGMTIMMVTHELDVARFCRRMVVMRDGRVIRDQPIADRLSAAGEINRLRAEQQTVQLTA